MTFYPSRKRRTRKQEFKRRKNHLLITTNLFIVYVLLVTVSFITSNSYSYFADNTQFTGSIITMDNFCDDKEYKKNHKELCQKCKDNSGIGNGSEQCDEEDFERGDEDNPGHQDEYCPDGNCNDHNNGNGSEKKEDKEKLESEDGINNLPREPSENQKIESNEEQNAEHDEKLNQKDTEGSVKEEQPKDSNEVQPKESDEAQLNENVTNGNSNETPSEKKEESSEVNP